MSIADNLLAKANELSELSNKLKDSRFTNLLERLEDAANRVGMTWSGSWLGYHSRVYYEGFAEPPPGAHFSQEWGMMELYSAGKTIGEWREYRFKDVEEEIKQNAGNPDISEQEKESQQAKEFFEEAKSSVLSLLSRAIDAKPNDKFMLDLREKTEKEKIFDESDFINAIKPSGQLMSRDMVALEKGLHTPPHINILAQVLALRNPFKACGELAKITQRAASHISNIEEQRTDSNRIGTKVFIGHGRSFAWRDLKDFIKDRLHLPWDEFNRVPVAGITNVARLSQMLEDAAIAFLILTAEDEQTDGKQRARMNVIHEAGLFQGRLGFKRAIILLEEGCEEFSNIHGLGQIHFPKGNIDAVFEEIRRVLEREGLIDK